MLLEGGERAKAAQLLEPVLDENPDSFYSFLLHSLALIGAGRPEDTRYLLEHALLLIEDELGGRGHWSALSRDLLALALFESGQAERAESHLKEGNAIREELYGEGHPETALSLFVDARGRWLAGELRSASRLLEAALDLWKTGCGGEIIPAASAGMDVPNRMSLRLVETSMVRHLVTRAGGLEAGDADPVRRLLETCLTAATQAGQ
jgi:hypothetical protein